MTRALLRAAGGLVGLGCTVAVAAAIWVSRPLPPGLIRSGLEPGVVLRDRSGLPLRDARAADGSRRRWVSLDRIDPDLLAAFSPPKTGASIATAAWTLAALRAARGNLGAGRWSRAARPSRCRSPGSSGPRPDLDGQGEPGALGAPAGAAPRQAGDSGAVPEPGTAGPGGDRRGVGRRALLRRQCRRAEPRAGRTPPGLARAPSADNPLVSQRQARLRRAYALTRLRTLGYASADAVGVPAESRSWAPTGTPFLAPHFTTRILGALERDGAPASGVWLTSLDLALQDELESEVRHTVETLADRGAGQAAAVVLDNTRGEILAWVGSPDFWADTAGQVDMVVGPGSRARRSSPSCMPSPSIGALPPRRFCRTSRGSTRPGPAPIARATTIAATTARCAPGRRSPARTTFPPWSSRAGSAWAPCFTRSGSRASPRWAGAPITTASASRSATET